MAEKALFIKDYHGVIKTQVLSKSSGKISNAGILQDQGEMLHRATYRDGP